MLCFVDADWPLIGGSFRIAQIDVLWPGKAAEKLTSPGALTPADIDLIHHHLAAAFPPSLTYPRAGPNQKEIARDDLAADSEAPGGGLDRSSMGLPQKLTGGAGLWPADRRTRQGNRWMMRACLGSFTKWYRCPTQSRRRSTCWGIGVNILIGHFLAGHPNSRIGAILEAVGSERNTVRTHLQELEAAGVVTVDIPPGHRQGLSPRYSVNRQRWFEMGVRLISYLPSAFPAPAPPVKPTPVPRAPQPEKPVPSPAEDDPAAPRVYWEGPSRGSWSRFGQDLTKLIAQSAPDIFVVTYTEPGLGPVKFGHVVVQGRDLRIGPGQPLVLVDPVDPSTWRVGPQKRRTAT